MVNGISYHIIYNIGNDGEQIQVTAFKETGSHVITEVSEAVGHKNPGKNAVFVKATAITVALAASAMMF